MTRTQSVGLLLVFAGLIHGQNLRPPDQTYIYDFAGNVGVAVPATPALNLGASFSIEFWMMLDRDGVDSQFMRIFSKGIPANSDPFTTYTLSIDSGTHRLSYSQSSGSAFSGATIAASLNLGQWYHIAVVSDNLQVTLYLNGQQQARFTATAPPPSNSGPLVLSGQTFGDGTKLCCGFPGSLRQFRVWGRALQSAEIASVATKTLAGNEPGLLADWPFDDGQGQTIRDLGPNHLNVQLTPPGPGPWFPRWLRTALVDGGPYFQVQRSAIPANTSKMPQLLIPIDFDSDGRPDLLVCGHLIHTLTKWPCGALRNDRRGGFTDATLQVLGPDPPSFETPSDGCVADFNGDGRADVYIFNGTDCCGYPPAQGGLLLQTADGRLQNVTATNLPKQLLNGGEGACGDIDGDGSVDIFLVQGFFGAPEIYLNDGQGHFSVGDPSRLPAVLRSNASRFIAGAATFIDVNRDGHLDLYLGPWDKWDNTPRDLLLLNDGHGFFAAAPDNALPARYGGREWGTVSSKAADIDGDGWPDLVNTVDAPNYAEGAVQILLNNHDGTFRDATERIVQPAWPRYGSLYSDGIAWVNRVYPADFNGDGFVDLLLEGGNEPSRLFLNTGPARGGFLVDATELLPRAADYFAIADFDGDGAADFAAMMLDCCAPATVESWLQSRKFAFTPDLIPTLPKGPFFLRGSVLNSASFSADALAPGELVTIFGRDFGPDTLAVASPISGVLPTQLSGTRVLFNNVAAPMIYAASGVVSAIVPFSVAPQTRADVVVEYQGQRSPPVSIFVAASAPGIFTIDGSGGGAAAVLNYDSVTGAVSVNSPQNPAQRGGVISVYMTGAGKTVPPSNDGSVATGTGGLSLPIEAGLDYVPFAGMDSTTCKSDRLCVPVEVLYAGPAPGIVAGVTQLNLRLPASVSGTRALAISAGGVWSQLNVTVSIR